MVGLNYCSSQHRASCDRNEISHLLSLLRREEELRPVEEADVGSGGGGLSLAVEHCTQLSVIMWSGGSLSSEIS